MNNWIALMGLLIIVILMGMAWGGHRILLAEQAACEAQPGHIFVRTYEGTACAIGERH